MTPGAETASGGTRFVRTAGAVAHLAEREALQRLELMATVSRSLAQGLDDYVPSLAEAAEACVPDFCDLFAVEVIADYGRVDLACLQTATASGITRPDPWPGIGTASAPEREPVLAHRRGQLTAAQRDALDQLTAESLIVAPIVSGGITLGWLVLATGRRRRGFRPSALRIGTDMATLLGAVMQRVLLVREARTAARDQARTARWLRRVAGIAAGVAGAATPQQVLEEACAEACNLHNADGVAIRWVFGSGREVRARAGWVDPVLEQEAFDSADADRPIRTGLWLTWPLLSSRPHEQATLVLFLERELGPEEEISLRSLAALIPIAFDRATGTEMAIHQEAHLRTVVETSPGALLTLGADGRVASANAAARVLFGGPAGDDWELPSEVRGPILRLVTEAVTRGARCDQDVVTETFDLTVSAAPLSEPSADRPSVVVVASDLSERRRAERALLQTQKLEAMGQVAGRVAHDFNNLLTLITGYSELLSQIVDDDTQRAMLAKIDQATKRAADLTQQMLALTRRQVGVAQAVDLRELVGSLEPMLRRIGGEGVEVMLRSTRRPVVVQADKAQLEQTVLNLAINARDALGEHGRLTVRVSTAELTPSKAGAVGLPPGAYARLTVTDDGPGMTADVLARCIEPFFTTKRHGEGSGLGLPSVRAAAAELGGTLRLRSKPGKGTVAEVWIPGVTVDAVEDQSVGPGDAYLEDLTGLSVLVVEDDDSLRELTTRALVDVGAVVTACATAEDALDRTAVVSELDAAVTDVRLPGMSGVDLATKLRAEWPGLPVLFVTGYANPSTDRLDALPGPRPRLLHKPFRPNELGSAIALLVKDRSGNQLLAPS